VLNKRRPSIGIAFFGMGERVVCRKHSSEKYEMGLISIIGATILKFSGAL